ncbi:hypothetical protein FHR92_004662 [Fontibacillus solani]|uniref:Polymerase nucleotidyl transferase domain-containing protein n=1 Tax=Fontibacillus solani TaxID=1572857 RepID=A0A7W3SXQ0_9BACL|nr:nucleotidyltransferase domain-containing protein [Fontibacillus solani]MBA9088166.1 hypothetical protein [Fontibacillus solani]
MLNVMNVADILVNHIKTNCPDDIAIVAYYGSYAQGTATEHSDLDFFYIPATPDGYRQSIAFILEDISFDFWPISWERAEQMASFDDPKTSVIADSKLLYTRSEDDRSRFEQLHNKVTTTAQDGLQLLEKSEQELRDTYVHLYKMSRMLPSDNIAFFRYEARSVLTKVLYSLARLNQTYVTKGWGKNLEQIYKFKLRPAQLEKHITTITQSGSCNAVLNACEELTQETLELLMKQKETFSTPPAYHDRMKGAYEELKGMLDKIILACDANDYTTAFFWSVEIQELIAMFIYHAEKGYWPIALDLSLDYQELYNNLAFPDLVSYLDPHDLAPLCEAVKRLDARFESCLKDKGVKINRFDTLEQFAASFHS